MAVADLRLRPITLALLLGAVPACEDLPEGGESFARGVIGPEGGQLTAESLTLDIPAGALTDETEIELRRTTDIDLSLPGYNQRGSTVSLFPTDLQLALPAALTFDDGRDRAAVLFEQDGLDVVALGQTAYLNEFTQAAAAVAESEDTEPLVTFTAPTLASDPTASLGTPQHQTFRMELTLAEPTAFNLDVVLSAYDIQQVHGRQLRGTGDGECGFRLTSVTGGSLRSDCSDSRFTATIRTAGTQVSFDVEPLQANNLDIPIAVGVVAGGSDIAFQGGFFGYDTCPDGGC